MILKSLQIQIRLKQIGKSQFELAKFLGMNDKAVSKMLRLGTTRESTAMKIADFVALPLGEIAALNVPAPSETHTNDDKVKDLERIIELQKELIEALKKVSHD
jgi:transcriptional regulator with XRE-family HTH domain